MMKLGIALVMLLLAVGLFLGVTQPQYEATQSLNSQGTQLDQILAEATEFQRLKSALVARYNALPVDQLARLEKFLPDHVDNVRLILDVDSLASRNGLSLENVIINSSEEGTSSGENADGVLGSVSAQRTPYGSISLQFGTKGSYAQFVSFLGALEQSLRLVDVINLNVRAGAPSSDTGAQNPYTYSVTMRTYWLK